TRENLIVSHTNSTSVEWQPTFNKGQEINLPRNTRSQRLPSTSSQLSLSQAPAGGDNSVTNQHPEVEEEVSTGAARPRDVILVQHEASSSQVEAGGENLDVDCQSEAEEEVKEKKVIVRQSTSSSRKQRQLARNKGQEYVTASGKTIEKKVAEPLPKCRRGCAEKVPPDVCAELCDSIWTNLGDANARRAYLSGQIQPSLKQSQRVNQPDSSKKRRNRVFTVRYFACVKGLNTEVCKECFMKIYQVSKKVIEVIIGRKIGNTGGVQVNDRRGESSQTLAEERLQAVIAHINSFPRYKSHYARNKTNNEFLPSNLTVKIMYDEYVKKCDKAEDTVSRWTYEREFHKLGLKIKPLKIDTCHTCDTLQMAVKNSKSEIELNLKKSLQEEHHLKAQEAIDVKKKDKLRAKSEETVETVAFDLQQCLPTPNLPSSIVFYLRQLWVYNLTIHIMPSDQSLHNMWHEGEGGRGANQVGSALYRFIINLPDEVEHLILWSDTCGGQNKNEVINTALMTALNQKKTLKTIDQKFLVPGHTHLECDSDHAVIEERKKRSKEIHIPRDWYNLVRGASKKFSVHLLGRDQFNFKDLLTGRDSPLVKRKVSTSKDKFVWKNVVWLQHRRNLPLGIVAFKTSFSDEDDFSYLDMRRRKNSSVELSPKAAYAGPNKISIKKKKDLLSMLHLVDPDCHAFYHALQTDSGEADDIDPDILPSSDIEDSGEE
ncbi:Signal recognition particle receptor subunit alpha-like protein, partial [Frankliniella fusca]